MTLTNVVEAKIINGNTVQLLCQTDLPTYKVVEFQIELDGIEINHEREIISPDLILNDNCYITIPVKSKGIQYPFIIRDWK